MAEFENGYCTGCGMKTRHFGHRAYCWRVVECITGTPLTYDQRQIALRLMNEKTTIAQFLLRKLSAMYYHYNPERLPEKQIVE